ncbi:tail fiber domain-containing protein [Dyadobacter crusticola]|uniref:tail fiber domain-containing protein n=1 Tax=Dyadobacter crusticola TaxID=292407 RepID=UPI00068EAB3F|nr:tail fiber domain-containing protein [Dyadobacter crusticola]
MNHLIRFFTLFFIAGTIYAQVPQKFTFQGVARDASGKLLADKNVGLRLSIRPVTALGTPVYQETHTTQTSANGIFNISVGGGTVQSGQFSEIKWASEKFFLQVELDPNGGSNYVNLGATELLSVPYALHAEEAGRWKNFDPVVHKGKLDEGGLLSVNQTAGNEASNDAFLIWYPRKAAFRNGSTDNYETFKDENIGLRSFATGMNAIAKGAMSVAMGVDVEALGHRSTAIGDFVKSLGENSLSLGDGSVASAENSVAIGNSVKSIGNYSIALGYNLQSNARYGTTIGMSNDISDAFDNEIKPTQRLFQIGNGDAPINGVGSRKNALTILRNGNVGIGNNVLLATHILDVGHRIRLRSNPGYTAGLWLDDAGGAQYCFIGGVNDSQAGFYFAASNAWRFNVHNNGSAWLAGTLTQNSDFRLKRDIVPLSANFEKLSSISGRHYYWKDPQRSQGLQTGLIAQEVEGVFPELVETDKDGYKSVNYIGLIPHLLEAVKELKRENARLGSENKKLTADVNKWADLQKRIEAIEASLVQSQATLSK